MVYGASLIALLFWLLIKRKRLKIDTVQIDCCDLQSPNDCVQKLEMITWMKKVSEDKGRARTTKIFEGFLHSYILRRKGKPSWRTRRSIVRGSGDEAENQALLKTLGSDLSIKMTEQNNRYSMKLSIINYMVEQYLQGIKE